MSHCEKGLVFLVLTNVMLTIGEGWSDLALAVSCLAFAVFHLFRSVPPSKEKR